MKTKKSLSQNFLYDPSILERIIGAAGLSPDDTVLEIGPGPGAMTMLLARRVKRVVAIELDKGLYERLGEKLVAGGIENVTLLQGDALRFDYGGLGRFKAVANIPYHITTPIIFKLLEQKKDLISMTLTVQKEVAERIVAGPGGRDYGVLSIMVQYHARPRLAFIVPAGAFRPVPKVDSACLHIDVYEKPAVSVRDEKCFFRVVKTAFSHRRKTILNSLRASFPLAGEALRRAGMDPSRRPETFGIEDFARLSDELC